MKITYLLAALAITPGVVACSAQKKTSDETAQPETGSVVIGMSRNSRPIGVLPKATAFQMNGDYADNVAINLNPDGSLAYFPAPTDITEASRPVDLGNGWWLNRQGISGRSVFTRYTFEEYAKLKNVPSVEELKKAIIPGSAVTAFQELPISAGEAMQNLDSIRSYVSTPHRQPSILRPKR